MKVRTLNRVVYVGITVLLADFVVSVVGGLMERPFVVWRFLSHLMPIAIFVALTPVWLKEVRRREAAYGRDGILPAGYSRRLWAVLGVALFAMALCAILAFVAVSSPTP